MIKQNKKVLVIRCGLLGDTIDATSVIKPLIQLYGPSVEIYWVSKPGICELFKFDSRVKKAYSLRHTKLPFFLNIDKFRIILDSLFHPFDLILNLEISNKFNDIVKYSRSREKIGMPYKFINDDIFEEHRVNHQLRILDIFYNKYDKTQAKPSIIGEDINNIKNKFPVNKEYIVLCPTNSHVGNKNHRGYRSWPEGNWKKLINKIINETVLNILLVGNKDEQKYFETFHPLNERVFDLSGMTSIPELISIMKLSDCVVATDSGSVHVAGATAKNIVSIHGPTNSFQSSPFKTENNNIRIASLNLKCSPCYDTDVIKSCPKNICMYDLDAEKVFSLIKSL